MDRAHPSANITSRTRRGEMDLKGNGVAGSIASGLVQEIMRRTGAPTNSFSSASQPITSHTDWATRSWIGCAERWTIRRVNASPEIFVELKFPKAVKDPKAVTPAGFLQARRHPGDATRQPLSSCQSFTMTI